MKLFCYFFTIIEIIEIIVINFAGKCSFGDTGIEGIGWAQGPFCSVQLFGAWPHQVQWCAAGLLQPVPCKTVPWQSQTGPRYDSPAGY